MKNTLFVSVHVHVSAVSNYGVFFTPSHLLVWQVEQKLPVKASRPPECRVDRVKSVCSTNDHYLPTTVQAVHQGQQSGHNRTGQRERGGGKEG